MERQEKTADSGTEDNLIKFYDDRYREGYMQDHPIEKKQRVFELIIGLNLPEVGNLLDFGCGNGEFTDVLRQALPKWNVYGVDISSVAIDNARRLHPRNSFFLISESDCIYGKVDFLFSHHVLEHVYDINKSLCQINLYLKKHSFVLHILPCGNPGSFEYNLCMLRIDGINKESQNTFAFEAVNHLRRLTTKQMCDYAAEYDFKPVFDYYSNQLYGALDWVTLTNPLLIVNMVNPINAKSKKAALKLSCLCLVLVLIKLMRYPANTIDFKRGKINTYIYYSLFAIFLILYPLSKLIDIYLRFMSKSEWKNKKTEKNGSEMYLYFKRELYE